MPKHCPEFDVSSETWDRFVARVKLHFKAESIPDTVDNQEKRIAMLLSAAGTGILNKYWDSIGGAEKMDGKSFDQIVASIKAIVNPAPLEISERYRFHTRRQLPGESVDDYMGTLRKLVITCNFGNDKTDPETARIRDQFIVGLANKEMQKYLLQQQTMTVDAVVQSARQFETAERSSNLIHSGPGVSETTTVSYVGRKKTSAPASSAKGRSGNKCQKCGRRHAAGQQCDTCFNCGKTGHFRRECTEVRKSNSSGSARTTNKYPWRPKAKSKSVRAANVNDEDGNSNSEDEGEVTCCYSTSDENRKTISGTGRRPTFKYLLDVRVNDAKKPIEMEMDTGCGESILSRWDWERVGAPTLRDAKRAFRSYSGHPISVLGMTVAPVQFRGGLSKLKFYVVNSETTSLFGRRWIKGLNVNLTDCRRSESSKSEPNTKANSSTSTNRGLDELIHEYADVFDGSLGRIKGIEAKLIIDRNADQSIRKFWPARPVPFAIEKRVGLELSRMERRGIIEKIPGDISKYASPIVVAAKRGTDAVRVCGDFKVTVNRLLAVDQYPLPRADDIFTKLGLCEVFTTLDLSEAYHQVEMDAESQRYLVINTKWGLYRYKRLPFGVASAPAIFQRAIDTIDHDLPGVSRYLDDILLAGPDVETHNKRLRAVFERFREYGGRLGLAKCNFGAKSVKYLGHIIDAQGLHTSTDKIDAIRNAPAPKNVSELRSFLGLVNYYGKFVSNLANLCGPLYALQSKDVNWEWTDERQQAFERVKMALSSTPVLGHYVPTLPLALATDASDYGVGATLYHILPDGTEKLIAFASHTLSKTQRSYSQIEKEAYSIIYGIEKFEQFLYGRKFTLVTDHRPLLALFGADKPIPMRTSKRLQRWA